MSLSPSVRDGLRPEQVAAFKRTAINTIIDAGSKLHMDLLAIATAIVFLHRFYSVKSLVRNDPFIISMACLYLGGKVEDSPKSVRDVLLASCQLRYKEASRRLTDEREFYERQRDHMFRAERTVLYALDFQFNVEHPYKPCLHMLNSQPLRGDRDKVALRDPRLAHHLAQFPINFINDSLKTEACLHFSATQIAAACIWLAMKLLKHDTHIYTEHKQLWWVAYGVGEEHLEGVEDMLQELYTCNLYSISSNHNLVLQSAMLLPPQQAHASAIAADGERQQAVAAAAAAAASAQQQAAAAVAAGALPAAVAAANRESWAAAPPLPAAPAAAASGPPAAAAAVPAPPGAGSKEPQAAGGGAVKAEADDDYDDFLFQD